MKSLRFLLRACLIPSVFGTVALAQPSVTAVVNAASNALAGLPNAGIAQGSIFVVFGANLGPAAIQQASQFPLQTTLAGTAVKVTVGGTTVDAFMVFTLASQVAAVLPSNTPTGSGTLTVSFNNQTSAAFPINVVRSTFGIFTLNQAGSGPAVVTNAGFQPVTLTAAAQPGEAMILWGTGLGPVPFPDNQPAQAMDLTQLQVEVLVGGKPANIRYRGRAPQCCAGLDQLVFDVPQDVTGCSVPVAVRAGGVVSNFATMAVAAQGRVCSDPGGLSSTDLERIAGGGELKYGSVVLSRGNVKITAPAPVGSFETRSDSGGGVFFKADLNSLIRSSSLPGSVSFGSCTLFTFRGDQGTTDPIRFDGLDAGAALNVSGPKGAKQIPRQSQGVYGGSLSQSGGPTIPGVPSPPSQEPYLDPGNYTVDNGSGGSQVGAFRATVTVPARLNWTNQDAINAVPRNQDLTVTWSGGDAQSYVSITGTSIRMNPTVGAAFFCQARTSEGRFSVPSFVLSALPASESQQGVPTGFLSVGTLPLGTPNRFSAPGLDVGFLFYSDTSSKQVDYR